MRSVVSVITILLALACVLSPAKRARADLDISSVDTPVTIDFDETVTDVNNGQWDGTGFQSTTAAGQLDSDSWAVTGMSDGNLAFGGTATTGDYARGAVDTPQTTGGFYAYTAVLGSRALWIQPDDSDFAPGTITLRIKNSTGSTVNFWDVSYNLYNDNNEDRGNSFNFSYSTDDSTYTAVTALDFTSPAAADLAGPTSFPMSTTISTPVAADGQLYIRWSGADVDGSGSRDEFGLDDITVTAAVPEPSAFLFGSLVCGVIGLGVGGRRLVAKLCVRG